ncbi:putative polarized growth protein [Talaromyces proteolyticus]|uniref:Polarized growth protein n=1 Tax=Talaromyces proteolyticus TaxID=1131652 RepID=A0AAD4KSV8_9EURO|nr:putative polarized growth protein [Talaromyces proteolyticus]KAH8700302.1 putative polarized growth protein [Talaromyces proteolyticus]
MAQTTPNRQPKPGDFLLVIHNFEARGEDELTLRKGEKIELVELDDGFGDGWYLGKHTLTGKMGLFPGVYTTVHPRIGVRRPTTASSGTSDTPSTDSSNRSPLIGSDHMEAMTMSPTEIESRNETTPQASRRASASETQDPNIETESPPLKQAQRSASSPLPTSPPLATNIQRTINQTFANHLKNGDSPVMNETLSVIDEHITDLSTPRHSITQDSKTVTDSGSEYSSHISHRLSYIHGHETDEEEEAAQPREEDVRKWDHVETARQLRSFGIDARHCDIFQEQEITGDVLLEMGQEFLLMKEFDFGVMGRRLKTWHKIKAFQEQVKGIKSSARGSMASFYPGDDFERSTSRAGHNAPFLPRIPSLSSDQRPSSSRSVINPSSIPSRRMPSLYQGSPGSPSTVNSSGQQDLLNRPSAASIREINHARRHSSMDSTHRSPALNQSGFSHHKKKSFDRGWTMTSTVPPFANRSGTAVEVSDDDLILQQRFLDRTNGVDSSPRIPDNDALDRGYFSGGEIETRRTRRLLRKRDSAVGSASHSRQSSFVDEQPSQRRHSRFGSTDSATRMSAAAKAYHGGSLKGRVRSTGSQIADPASGPPIVTNLEGKSSTGPSFFSPFAGRSENETTGRSSPSPFANIRNVGPKFRRAVGLRTTSDGASGIAGVQDQSPISPVKDFMPSLGLGRTGSTTPSATSKSSERHSTDGSGKAIDGPFAMSRPRIPSKAASKTKKDTSAYTRGLEKKNPQEQMAGCDYSGWMKKRSANLMTTWKPRLFVLRGRRLSYYYSENDTEERGLIDITAHRVLRADNDPLTALHATITGAIASPTSPEGASKSPTEKTSDVSSLAKSPEAPFIFKLVPPKSGVSRTVQFTKPTIHYFQVDNVKEGRLWMAALMKATIDRDLTTPVETTNKQKTISLKQALLMNQRPPALMETEPSVTPVSEPNEDDSGLKIQGLNLDKPTASVEPTTEEGSTENEAAPSLAASAQSPSTDALPETLPESVS